MKKTAAMMMRETFGEDRVRSLSPEERKRIADNLEQEIARRGAEEVSVRLRRAAESRGWVRQDGDQGKKPVDPYDVAAAVLFAATINTVLNPFGKDDSFDTQAQEDREAAEVSGDGGSFDPFTDPFDIKPPRPNWA